MRSIQNWVLGSFWIFMIVRAHIFWLYAPPELALTIGQCAWMIVVLILFFPRNITHDQWPRFWNYFPIVISQHNTPYTIMAAIPLLWNCPSEVVTRLDPVLILLILNHPYAQLYLFYCIRISLKLLFNSASPTVSIHSLIMIFFKVSNCSMEA